MDCPVLTTWTLSKLPTCPPLPYRHHLTLQDGHAQPAHGQRAQRHYKQHHFDWQTLFNGLDGPSPAPSLRSVARKYSIPPSTLSFHYGAYKRALSSSDEVLLAVAQGVIDGRRDNHRLFSRPEEAQLLAAVNKENIHPNKPVVHLLALRIHEENQAKAGPTDGTRSQAGPVQGFKASDTFVQRIKRRLNKNVHKPKLVKRSKKAKNPTEEEKDALAVLFREKVVRAVRSYGGGLTINADEIAAKMLIKPRTLWHEKGGPPPLMASNHTGKEAFTMILATTAAGHKLIPALFVVAKTARALKKFDHLKGKVHLILADCRWVNQEMWDQYVEEVIAPFCSSSNAAFVVDSHGPHISDFAGDVYANKFLEPIQVPEGMTDTLQPNDVGVYGPLNSLVAGLWLSQKRDEPEKWDSLVVSLERYIDAWAAVDRDTVRKAWVTAVP